MVISILRALAQIKTDVAVHLQAATVERLCRELGHRWRDRILTPVVTVHAFLLQVLHGNTACDHVPHLMGGGFTGEAYGQARRRLPLELFQRPARGRDRLLGLLPRRSRSEGAVIGFGCSTVPVAPCPIRLNSSKPLASRGLKNQAVVFPWPMC